MASLTTTVNDMTTRSQLALRFMSLLISRDGATDPEELVTRCYSLSDAFIERAREDWRAERAAKKGAGDKAPESESDESQ